MACSTADAASAVAPSICARLVRRMRASPATVLKDQSVPNMRPWIVNAVSHPAQGEPVYPHLPSVWRTMGGAGATIPTIESLPGTDLAMVSAVAGADDCLQFAFFEWKQGGAFHAIADPPMGAAVLCSREGVWGGYATVLGRPAFIAYGLLGPANRDSLLIIAPWKAKHWGPACPVSIRFRYRYDVTQLYCGASDEVCRAARKLAPEVKRRYHAWDVSSVDALNEGGGLPLKFHFGGAPSAQGKALVARARTIGISRRLTSGGNGQPAWLRQASPRAFEYFPLELAGHLYVAAAGRWGIYPANRLANHWLFIVFHAPSVSTRRLVVLTAFTAHRVTSGVRAIDARNESVAASGPDSTSIPSF